MAAWKLRDDEWVALDELRFSAKDVDVFRNATMILMTGVGRSKFDIAEDLGCSPATVDNVRKRYRQQGLEGLQRRKPTGRVSRATPAILCNHLPRITDAGALPTCRRIMTNWV